MAILHNCVVDNGQLLLKRLVGLDGPLSHLIEEFWVCATRERPTQDLVGRKILALPTIRAKPFFSKINTTYIIVINSTW
jgi:hypothetical protein